MANKTDEITEVLPQPLKSCEEAVKSHREVLVATLANATAQKEAAKEQYHQWTGAEAMLQATIKDLDEKTTSA